MNKKVIIGGIIVAAACAVILPRLMKKEPFAEAVADPIVEVATPETRDIRLYTSLVGTVEPEDVVYVYPKASGDVTEVKVAVGTYVNEGDVLCTIDTKQVESAKNSMDSAKLALDEAQDELSRQSVLYAGGGISDQAYEQYQNKVKSAQITYNNAKTEYEKQLSYSQIQAPISGTVEICNMELYDQVSQGDLICVIAGEGSRVVSFSVTERIRHYLWEGDRVVVERDGEAYEGTITEVSLMADTNTGLFKAKARLDDDIDLVRFPTGSMVKLYVISEKAENVTAIPVDAVYYDGGLSYIYTYDPETQSLHKVQVEVGLYDSDWIEVKSEIDMDTQVLTTWSSELYEGTTVRLKNDAAATETTAAAEITAATETTAAAEITADAETTTAAKTEAAGQNDAAKESGDKQ